MTKNRVIAKNIPPLDKRLGYKAYILGEGIDGIAKTPKYASAICGIPEEQIYQLARELGHAKAPYIAQGWGPSVRLPENKRPEQYLCCQFCWVNRLARYE